MTPRSAGRVTVAGFLLAGMLALSLGWLATEGARRFNAPPVALPRQMTLMNNYIEPLNPPPAGLDAPAEIGLRLQPEADVEIIGLRFNRFPGDTGPLTATVWIGSGSQPATVTFPPKSRPGWQEVQFEPPLPVPAGSIVTASVWTPAGEWLATGTDVLAVGNPARSGRETPRHTGVYRPDNPGRPKTRVRDREFWVDMVFLPEESPR
jgi:hypothetical protein